MAIKTVQAKSGQMYDVNSPQGKTIVASATVGQDADFDSSNSSLGADASMTETLQLIYGETQESSESLDNIEAALVDEGKETAEERAARLAKSNKDKKENKFSKALGAGKDKVGAGLSRVKKSLSGTFGLALLGGGLLLLNQFADELAGPEGMLTKFLKYMKEQLFPDVKKLYLDVKSWWKDSWASVSSFFTFFEDVLKEIKKFIVGMDTDGDGVLSKEELDETVSKIWTSIKDNIWATLGAISSGVSLAIIGTTIAKGFFAGRALATAGGAAGGLLGLAGIVALGVWKLADNAAFAYNAAITDELTGETTKFDGTEFISKLLGGKDAKGGWRNALNNAWDKALIGGASGALLGSAVPGLGTAVGGVVGFLVGGILGGVLGQAGSDKIDLWVTEVTSDLDFAINSIGQFFKNLVNGLKSAGDPDKTFMEAFKESDMENVELQEEKLVRKKDELEELKESNEQIAKGEKSPLFGESLIFSSSSPLGQYLNKIEVFGKRLSEDVDGEAEAALTDEILILGNEINKTKMIIANKLEQSMNATKLGEVPAFLDDKGSAYIPQILDDSSTPDIDEAEMAYIAGTQRPTAAMIKTSMLKAEQDAKKLMDEIKTEMVADPSISLIQDRRSSTEINNANFVSSASARNDLWLNHDLLRTASGI